MGGRVAPVLWRRRWLAVVLGAPVVWGCAQEGLRCGDGTEEDRGACMAVQGVSTPGSAEQGPACGDGTVRVGDECLPVDPIDPIDCGPGTFEQDGECLPLPDTGLDLVCGPGTVEVGGVCVPEEQLVCGPGTIEVDDVCVPESVTTCGEGTVDLDGACVAVDAVWVNTPLTPGFEATVVQGQNGDFSHFGSSRHAVDFEVPEGTSVTAALPGIVIQVFEESDTGCDDVSCADLGNHIILDHGDGTKSLYWHLLHEGVHVEVGEQVAQGQVIGLSGNTGFSTDPHLHFAVEGAYPHSLPIKFEELRDVSFGVATAGSSWPSANEVVLLTDSLSQSDCALDTFAHMGVWLNPGTPCIAARWGEEYPVSGFTNSAAGKVVVEHYDLFGGTWRWDCVEADAYGVFSTTLVWDAGLASYSYLMIHAGDEHCGRYQGWYSSPRVNQVP
jgi:hypothetical protein